MKNIYLFFLLINQLKKIMSRKVINTFSTAHHTVVTNNVIK